MNPARAHRALAPRPETFPRAAIHPARESIREPFEARKDREFFYGGNDGS